LYRSSEFIIYPSLSESFGLGILEALENGCKVIGADLQYIHAVCKPSLVFDPESEESITEAFEKAIQTDLPPSEQKVFNEIDKLIQLITI
jgi:glycosyltransferase involved in cell wall biosynthesis